MIIVFGSINVDMIFPVDHFPAPGETIASKPHEISYGGKGANQALAASRLGGKVALVGATGDDDIGNRMLRHLRREGVTTSGVAHLKDHPTGTAIITVDKTGENQIIISGGANLAAAEDQIPDEIMTDSNILLMQMETPTDHIETLIHRADENGMRAILNLAPAKEISLGALQKLEYLIVNETEAAFLAEQHGIENVGDGNDEDLIIAIAKKLGIKCILTCGKKGSIMSDHNGTILNTPALPLEAEDIVDTTGAGDAFCGTFVAALHSRMYVEEALKYANIAGSLACTKKGAQSSYAYFQKIEEIYNMLYPE